MRTPTRRPRTDIAARARALAISAVAVALVVTGCSATDAASSTTTPATSPAATSDAAGCVADPAALAAGDPSAPDSPLPAATVAALDAATAAGHAETSATGAIVAVQTPEGRYLTAVGTADAAGTPMSVDDVQRVGSITKTFTGTLVLQLAEEGKLSLDDPISDYVDGVPNGENITLHELITMTSGLASYSLSTELQNRWFADPYAEWSPQQLLDAAWTLDPLFAPGEKFNYSNTNFILLGEVIERVEGRPYADVVRSRITEPLGLEHTVMPAGTDPLPAPHATGLTLQGTADGDFTPVDATGWNPSFAWTAGQLTSTAADLLTYARAIVVGDELLDASSQTERMTFPGTGGYGEAIGCIDGWVGHTGEIPGFDTVMFHETTSDTTVVVFANSDILSGTCSESKTMPDNPSTGPCMAPATRVFVAVADALGHPFTPNPAD
jgi:D-alanyl-D-alanine carboxypeptidase